jgi:sugar phosphate isomerase/epimerase
MGYPEQDVSFYEPWDRLRGVTEHSDEMSPAVAAELQNLFEHLTDQTLTASHSWYSRLAPSIITRGEAEMLGVSDPRFARRVLFFDEVAKCLGFVNLRRIRRLGEQVRHLKILSEKTSSIADSVFLTPARFPHESWRVLSIPQDLTVHYGEADTFPASEETLRAVPYMKHVAVVGGGLCAQACCFMATLFSYARAKSAVSVPEISFLVTPGGRRRLQLTGLNSRQVQDYFRHSDVGLWATIQVRKPVRESPDENDWRKLLHAIKAYLNAGCPILCGVDLGRMNGIGPNHCITQALKANRVYCETSNRPFRDRRHMVLLVGYEKTGNRILCNDPAVAPLVDIHISALLNNSCYQIPARDKFGKDAFPFGTFLNPPTIIPVTPQSVRLPLLTLETGDFGLMEIASAFKPEDYLDSHLNISLYPRSVTCLTALTRVGALIDGSASDVFEADAAVLGALHEHALSLRNRGWREDQWLWVQRGTHDECVLLWNAEADPSLWNIGKQNYKSFLVSVGAMIDNVYSWRYGDSSPRSHDSSNAITIRAVKAGQHAESQFTPIKLGVITSFSHGGMSAVNSYLSGVKGNIGLDLYCFMRWDSTYLRPTRRRLDAFRNLFGCGSNVCSWLASNYRNDHYVRRVAKRLSEIAEGFQGCYAISTFLPEITHSSEKHRRKAINALCCVARIAAAYNDRVSTADRKIQVIEMVGGSLIDDRRTEVMRNGQSGGEASIAFVLEKADATRRILEALEAVAEYTPENLSIAIELEPGRLFAVSEWQDLVRLASGIELSPVLKKKVGFNCDLAHWSLADISPEVVANDLDKDVEGLSEGVGARIVHAHISDFGKGHFGDLAPGTVNKSHFFCEWLKVISSAYTAAKGKGLKPSGYISVELELPESKKIVMAALEAVASLCREAKVNYD